MLNFNLNGTFQNGKHVPLPEFIMMLRIILLTLFIILSCPAIWAANPNFSEGLELSLDKAEKMARSNPERAQAILDSIKDQSVSQDNELMLGYVHLYQGLFHKAHIDQEKAWDAYALGMPIAEKYNDHYLSARLLREMGSQKNQTGDHVAAIEYYYNAIFHAEKVDAYRVMGACYSLIGNLFRVLGDYYQAIEFTLQAEKNYTKADYEEGSAWILYTLGVIYLDLNLYEDALQYLEKSLGIYERVALGNGDSRGVAICMDQIGKANLEQGELLLARESFNRSNSIYTLSDNIRGESISLKNMAKVEYQLGEYDKSLELLLQAHRINTSVNAVFGMSTVYEFIGKSLYAKNQYQAGIDSLEKGLEYAIVTKQRPIQKTLYGTLANMYYEQGDEAKAFKYFNRQAELSDSLSDKATSTKLAGLNIYEMEQRRQQIRDLEVQNQLSNFKIQKQQDIQIALLLGAFVVFIFLLFTSYLYYSKRKTLTLVEEQREELEQLVATKDKFFSIIAHDLRGPLGMTMQTLDTFLEMFPDMSRDEIFEMLKNLDTTSATTFKLLENLLMWARLQSGSLVAEPKRIDLSRVILATLEVHQAQAEKKGVDIKIDVDTSLRSKTDEDMLATIIRNLVSNALKFTASGGRVAITAEAQDQDIRIDIQDTGIGIPESKIPEMFTVGNKFNRKGTDGEGSSGLGLILVKEFVELQGGQINIQSVEAEGTTVSFTVRGGGKYPLL